MTTDSVRQEKGDLISRNDAIEVINKLMEIHFDRKVVLGKVWQQIKDLPSAQKKGKWVSSTIDGKIVPMKDGSPVESCWCSECGDWLGASDEYAVKGNFCPNCGADMRGESDG